MVRHLAVHRKTHDADSSTGRHTNEDGSPQLSSEQQASVQRFVASQAPLRQSPSATQGLPTSATARPPTRWLHARIHTSPTRTGPHATGAPSPGKRSHAADEQQGTLQRRDDSGASAMQRPDAHSAADSQGS